MNNRTEMLRQKMEQQLFIVPPPCNEDLPPKDKKLRWWEIGIGIAFVIAAGILYLLLIGMDQE